MSTYIVTLTITRTGTSPLAMCEGAMVVRSRLGARAAGRRAARTALAAAWGHVTVSSVQKVTTMNLFRYLLAALIMYRSPREGRQPATCCGCGKDPVQVLLWGPADGPSRYETYCTACSADRWVEWSRAMLTSAPLPADALTNEQVDAAALAGWPTRTAVLTWLSAPGR